MARSTKLVRTVAPCCVAPPRALPARTERNRRFSGIKLGTVVWLTNPHLSSARSETRQNTQRHAHAHTAKITNDPDGCFFYPSPAKTIAPRRALSQKESMLSRPSTSFETCVSSIIRPVLRPLQMWSLPLACAPRPPKKDREFNDRRTGVNSIFRFISRIECQR